MTTTIDGDSIVRDATSINDTDSPYTTQNEDLIQVDVSSGAVTVTLASADTDSGRTIDIRDVSDNAGTNNITVNTEGSETVDPGGESSKTITEDGGQLRVQSDGTNWFAERAVEADTARVIGALAWEDTNRQSLSGNLTLTTSDARIQSIDPGGANRDVILPAEANGLTFIIANRADAAEDLVVKEDSGTTTIATVNQDDVGVFRSDGTGWLGFAAAGGVT